MFTTAINVLKPGFSAQQNLVETPKNRVFLPVTDIMETKDDYRLAIELPGIEKDQITMKMEANRLSVSAERKLSVETDNKNYYRIERSFGTFNRVFILPKDAKSESITASFENGLLTVLIPKKEDVKPREINIQ